LSKKFIFFLTFITLNVHGAEFSAKSYDFKNFDSSTLRKSDLGPDLGAVNYYNNLLKITNQPISDSNSTRGAAEINVYQKASQGTVLIVTDESLGSGAVITNKGHILTNYHVVGKNKSVTVFFKTVNSEKLDAKNGVPASVIKVDELADLALIKIDPKRAPKSSRPIPLAKYTPSVGADAHAIGHPAGQLWTYTKGYISQIRDNFSWINHKANVIQVQTPINPGNSGGPLLDRKGDLIGINSFIDTENSSMNFAVALSEVERFLKTKGSRMLPSSTSSTCEAEVGEAYETQDTDEFGPSTNLPMDTTCDKKINLIIRKPHDASQPIFMMLDVNGDGAADVIAVDEDRDDKADYSILDTDFDGKFESRGIHTKGEWSPDKIVAINE